MATKTYLRRETRVVTPLDWLIQFIAEELDIDDIDADWLEGRLAALEKHIHIDNVRVTDDGVLVVRVSEAVMNADLPQGMEAEAALSKSWDVLKLEGQAHVGDSLNNRLVKVLNQVGLGCLQTQFRRFANSQSTFMFADNQL